MVLRYALIDNDGVACPHRCKMFTVRGAPIDPLALGEPDSA